MPIQAPQWTEFLSCPVCYNVFNEEHYRPISLACGHTVCRTCLSKFQQRKCPFDQSLITRDIDELPANFALLQLVSVTAFPDIKKPCIPDEYKKYYDRSRKCVEELALLLKPVSSSSTGSIISVSTSSTSSSGTPSCVLSRPMQRKLITLVNCQLVEDEGRARALRASRSLGERTVTELILQHQNPQQLSSNLWASVRGRGCQFLGPGMQEEVLKLILLALEDGSALSRKVLVLFVVQRLEAQYPQASKTAIGHVVQLLYRASCFKVTKRDEESSLMQLKEDYRTYECLRREHDSQVVQIAMEAGLRIAPDQWSSLLYGDSTHKSHMQSIIDKLQTPQTFCQSVSELLIALQRTGDPYSLSKLKPELEFLSNIDPSPEVPSPTWENLDGVLRAVKTVVEGLVNFLQSACARKPDLSMPFNARYKTSLCRDYVERGHCPRANSCTFAHTEEELEKYRQKSRKIPRGPGGYREEDRSRSDRHDYVEGTNEMYDDRLGYPQFRGPPPGPPPQIAPPSKFAPQAVPPPQRLTIPNVAPPPQRTLLQQGVPPVQGRPPYVAPPLESALSPKTAPPPQIAPPTQVVQPLHTDGSPAMETPATQIVEPVAVDVAGNLINSPVEALVMPGGLVRPSRDIVHPTVTPTAIYATPTPGYVTPVDPSTQQVGDPPTAVMPPNGDSAILQAGNVISPGNNMIVNQGMTRAMVPPQIPVAANHQGMVPSQIPVAANHQGMVPSQIPVAANHPGMVPPQIPVAANPQGMMQQGMNMEMQQGAMLPGGQPGMPPNMSQMSGMVYPFMPPYTPPGPGMMGPRFSMHPMMYGQYPYPAVHPYMAYYQQGFVPPDNHQMPYDSYYTSLNPFAEPWKPGLAHGPSQDPRVQFTGSQGAEKCSVCSERHEEEQRRRHLCDKHKHEHDTDQKYEPHTQSQTKQDINNKPDAKNNVSKFPERGNLNKQNGHLVQNGYSESNSDKKFENDPASSGNDEDQPAEWSINDDYVDEDYTESGGSESYSYKMQGGSKSRTDVEHFDRNNYQPTKQPQISQKDQQTSQQEHWKASQSGYNNTQMESVKSASLNMSKTPPIPVMLEPNAKLYRQSLNNLREKRNSLIQQLQDINKEATAHENKLEELSESLPNLFRFEPVDFREFDNGTLNETTVYASTLKHPEPLDTGPFSLKKTDPSNGEIFERLGAISGVPPRSVNDSIIASWTAATLKYSECEESQMESSQLGAYISQAPTEDSESKTSTTNSSKEGNSSKWSNVDQDFPYWKDVTQNLDSPMTTPPSTPCPASMSSSHSAVRVMSDMPSSSYDHVIEQSRSNPYRHRAESAYCTNTPTYGQPVSSRVRTSSDIRSNGSRSSAYISSSVNTSTPTSQVYKYPENYGSNYPVSVGTSSTSVRNVPVFSTEASQMMGTVSSQMIKPSGISVPQSHSYTSIYGPPTKATGIATSYWPSSASIQATSSSVSPSASYCNTTQLYGTTATPYDTSSEINSLAPFYRFLSSSEEDDIPFIEGSPIISKYGPISRSVNRNIQQTTQPVEAMADDDATKTVPVTAVTPLTGPPLPNAQKVPSRFTQSEDGPFKPSNRSSSTLTAYEKSYSLWTTELNLLEQKAKKASTEDEMLSVKLQAVQMQIALKEQELQQAQGMETSMCSEYLKNRH